MSGITSARIDRRTLLKTGASALLSAAFANPALAAFHADYRILSFYNIHTGEALKTCFRANGRIIHHALERISLIMRDHRTGECRPIDPRLMDQLYRIASRIHPSSPISIISGYRSPSTNAALRRVTSGVARKSLHMEGRAIDIRIPGIRTTRLRRLAVGFAAGGVGYYPRSDFVHLDTGPFKVW